MHNIDGGTTIYTPKLKKLRCPLDAEWMDKQNTIHPYNRILFSNKKDQTTDSWCNIGELQNHAK